MSLLLDLTPTHISIIKDICNYEHDSLIRLHTGTSELSPRMGELLDELGVTPEEYLDYSSEAFYQFQKLLEDPNSITQTPPVFLATFLAVAEVWDEELKSRYNGEVSSLLANLEGYFKIKPQILDLN